jgi:hypothetical protein
MLFTPASVLRLGFCGLLSLAVLPNSRAFPLAPAKHLGLLEHHSRFTDAVVQFIEHVGKTAMSTECAVKSVSPAGQPLQS